MWILIKKNSINYLDFRFIYERALLSKYLILSVYMPLQINNQIKSLKFNYFDGDLFDSILLLLIILKILIFIICLVIFDLIIKIIKIIKFY